MNIFRSAVGAGPVFGVLGALLCPVVVQAQEAPATAAPAQAIAPKAPVVQPLRTLAQAFPSIAWDSQAHGPLLAIAPDKTYWNPPDTDTPEAENEALSKPLFPPADRYGLNVGLVARHFKRQLISLPTMAVLAPETMVTLNRNLKPANPFLNLRTQENLLRLEASLSTDQWKALGSSNGIGLSDMTHAQEPLFEALLPENVQIERAKVVETLRGDAYDQVANGPPLVLDDSQRQGLRIRLDRTAQIFPVDSKNERQYYPSVFKAEPVGTEKLVMRDKPNSFAEDSSLFGQQLRFRIANRLKPSDLDLKSAAFEVGVPLTGAATVGDLIAAARKATGQEVYADGRLAKLAVAFRGDESSVVQASDLLKSLCWALCATYRRVGPTADSKDDGKESAYVLTYDREGIGARRGRIQEWATLGNSERENVLDKLNQTVFDRNPRQYLSFPKGNLLSPTPEALKAAEEFDPHKTPGEETIPVSMLTSAQREQLQRGIALFAKLHEANPTVSGDIRSDRVGINTALGLTFVIPGMGEVPLGDYFGETTKPPTMPSADSMKTQPVSGQLLIVAAAAPHDHAAVEALVKSAAVHGVRELWIQVPNESGKSSALPASLSALQDCVATGAAHHLPVAAVLSVMRSPAGSLPSRWSDSNIYGDTGSAWAKHLAQLLDDFQIRRSEEGTLPIDDSVADIAEPGAAEYLAQITRRAETVAATPGLAGLAFSDSAVTGYGPIEAYSAPGFAGSAFGYTVENRLAFLRAEGYDPIDIDPEIDSDYMTRQATHLPFFDANGSESVQGRMAEVDLSPLRAKWQGFLSGRLRTALTPLGVVLRTRNPQLPLYISAGGAANVMTFGQFYQPWTTADALSFAPMSEGLLQNPVARQKTKSYLALAFQQSAYDSLQRNGAIPPGVKASTMLALFCNSFVRSQHSDKAGPPDSMVLDMTTSSTSEVIAMIEGICLPVDAPAH